MIDIDSLWTSESAVENFHAVASEFYNVMCNSELPLETIKKLDAKRDFAMECTQCGQRHAGHGRIWSIVASTLNTRTPEETSPEHEEYTELRKTFFKEVTHIDVRDYAEPFLKATDEGAVIEAALEDHKARVNQFIKLICSSEHSPESDNQLAHLVTYACERHDTTHYLTPQQNNHHRTNLSGSRIPEEFVGGLSKLSQRIVLRDMSAVFREFQEQFPMVKIENSAFADRLEKKVKAKAKRKAIQELQQEKKKARVSKNKESAQKTTSTAKKPAVVDNPNLFILKPALMSDDWLIEYHVCGRKIAYNTFAEAYTYKGIQGQEGYDVYECPYGKHWHYGRKSGRETLSPANKAKRGLFWYKQSHKKANAFIHKIMMEEFH